MADEIIRDKSNPQNQIELFPDTPLIINDILRKGIQIAIVSRNPNKALCTRALFYYKARDAKDQVQPITSLITYNEVKNESKMYPFERIKNWSGVPYEEMLLFDSSSSSVQEKLGVKFKLVNKDRGLQWQDYQDALKNADNQPNNSTQKPDDPYDIPFYGQPPLGKLLGGGRFASVYDSAEDSEAVIKVMKYWERGLRKRFLEIYQVIKEGKPFKPGNDNDDQYLTMLAFELRNLNMIKELKAPKPENFTGWFMSTKIFGTALWKTPLYKQHPFSVPFQRLIKKAFHLIVDEIEETVRKYGVEHRDGHLANALFTMNGDQPAKAHLLDWGIAVRMQWDGKRYIRGDDVLVWAESESGAKYTPEEFRRYWITWMVKTEYEANVRRNAITEEDSKKFLKDLTWWFQR
ncbi:hypothetical protein K435DRAFT_822746 [Dendrothele bispora CBS 962.96]|uniref:Protein kinase domain-containing protein n=1 Tax=Dendrothele bispora (strain CBS 962.96) TaxID=1314807 RepID=A0A4S8L6N2_DENBC|nr:hypothetical protein K435DRAFT_822746 [Dendrothele bispora CBS 962.96]